MIGALAVLAAASLAAGCGGDTSGGHVAQQAAQTQTAATTDPAAAAPAADATSQALGAFPPANERAPSFRGFDQFDSSRAGTAFQEPASVAAARNSSDTGTGTAQPTAGSIPVTAAPVPGGTTEPTTQTTPTTEGTTTTGSDTTKTASSRTVNLDVDGAPVIAKVGTQIPASNPLFAVQSVTADKVVLKLNSGSFPGGSSTVDIAKGASVTLSNPASGNTVVITVVTIGEATATK